MLTVGGGVPVPLDGLVALSAHVLDHALTSTVALDPEEAASHRFDSAFLEISSSEKLGALVRGGHYPRGYIELFAVLERTGLEDLHVINRESIMKLGSQRHCKEGRAEAIMSVIGATGWFIEAPRTETLRELEKDLFLGLYPTLFLRETAEMLGARFYTSLVIRTDIDEDFSRILDIRGSLLPFNTHSQDNGQTFEKVFLPRWQLSEGDHPSVKLWNIEADGSVSIPEAAVLVPASHHEVMPLIASVTFAYPMDSGLYQKLGPAGRKGDRNRSIDLRE